MPKAKTDDAKVRRKSISLSPKSAERLELLKDALECESDSEAVRYALRITVEELERATQNPADVRPVNQTLAAMRL